MIQPYNSTPELKAIDLDALLRLSDFDIILKLWIAERLGYHELVTDSTTNTEYNGQLGGIADIAPGLNTSLYTIKHWAFISPEKEFVWGVNCLVANNDRSDYAELQFHNQHLHAVETMLPRWTINDNDADKLISKVDLPIGWMSFKITDKTLRQMTNGVLYSATIKVPSTGKEMIINAATYALMLCRVYVATHYPLPVT